MMCREFNQQVDGVLAGDVATSELSTRAVGEHLERCSSCAKTWNRVRSLLEIMPASESDRDVEAAVSRAREQLRSAFGRIGRQVVRFDMLRTPIGRIFVAMSDRGVCDVTLDDPNERDYRLRLARQATEVVRDRVLVEPAMAELEAYFQGRLSTFTVPVDLRGVTDFTRRVLRVTLRIPFRKLLSYGDVASRIGSPGASRAVGGALGRNPVPIIVPCHRVIARGGKLCGFSGGLDTKQTLLQIEGHALGATLSV